MLDVPIVAPINDTKIFVDHLELNTKYRSIPCHEMQESPAVGFLILPTPKCSGIGGIIFKFQVNCGYN